MQIVAHCIGNDQRFAVGFRVQVVRFLADLDPADLGEGLLVDQGDRRIAGIQHDDDLGRRREAHQAEKQDAQQVKEDRFRAHGDGDRRDVALSYFVP